MKYLALAIAICIASVSLAETHVDLSSQFNTDMQQFLFGTNFPLGNTDVNVAGVGFHLGTLGGDPNTLGAMERPYNSNSNFTAIISGLNIAVQGPTSLYTLIDEQFGRDGSYLGYVTVYGSHGESTTMQLVSGANVGNNWTAGFVTTLTDPSVQVQYYRNGQPTTTVDSETMAFYRQELALPSSFIGDTVTSMKYVGFNNGDVNLGDGVFAAATFNTSNICICPEPASMAALGVGICAFLRRKKR
ncbi:MAG: PEP-CTERM sorting domain-containing protein [Armatimonadetes bacterium]|nr:PEP-CTERM sorting domain-containing protein [Armatimonadota bacterium]